MRIAWDKEETRVSRVRRCDMSKPEVAEHVMPRFYTSFELLFLCSWDCRMWGLRKTVSAAPESCVHAIAFRVTPIDSPDCDAKPTYHGILRWFLLEVMCLLLRFQALPSSVLTVTCRDRSRTRESHYNMLKLQSIHNWSMALAGVQRSYNFPGEDMSRSTAQPWVLGWISHDYTCASGDHRLPVTRQSHIIVEIGGKFERINSIVVESAHVLGEYGFGDKTPNCFTTILTHTSLDCFARNTNALELWITYSSTCGNPYVPTSSALMLPPGAIPPCVWQAVSAFRPRILTLQIS